MRAFIQCDFTGHPCNPNAFVAFSGLKGYECSFQRYEELIANSHLKEDLIISGIGIIKRRLQDFRIECTEIDYPQEKIHSGNQSIIPKA